MLAVPKAIREQIRKGPRDVVTVVLWKDEAPREVEVPAAFKTPMKKAGVLAWFESLSFTHRKEYCQWIAEAKKEETRTQRYSISRGLAAAGGFLCPKGAAFAVLQTAPNHV